MSSSLLYDSSPCVIHAVLLAIKAKYENDVLTISKSAGRFAIPRERRSVHKVYSCLGPTHFRRAYRMTYDSFWRLHERLHQFMIKAFQILIGYEKKGGRSGGNYSLPPVRNGSISFSVMPLVIMVRARQIGVDTGGVHLGYAFFSFCWPEWRVTEDRFCLPQK